MKTLFACLAEHDTVLLRAIAERRGIEIKTSQLPDMAQEVAAAMLDPASIAEMLRWLTGQERAALDTLILNGGRLRMLRFARQFGEIRRFGPGSLARESPWRTPINAAEGLWYQGVIFRSFMEQSGISTEFAFIPTDLLPLLPAPQIDRLPFDMPRAEPPHHAVPGDMALIDDMAMLLALAQVDEIHILKEQLPPEAMARLQKQLLDDTPERLEFLYHLAQTAGFLYREGRALRLHRDPVRDWLKEERAAQLRRLQLVWRDDVAWNELWHVPTILCEDTGWRNDPLVARQMILNLLRRCCGDGYIGDRWLSIPGFVEAVKKQEPDFLRPDGDFESWYIRDRRSGQYLTGLEHWDKIEGALLDYLCEGPLHWLGIVSLGYQEGWQKPTAIQLTTWGMAFLKGQDCPTEEISVRPAQITPEGLVTLPREISLFDRFQLARIAEWRASRPDYVYEMTSAALRRAFGQGIQLDMVENFMNRVSAGEVPAATIARIRGWASRYGQVRLRRAVILETRSQKTMIDLSAHERIRPYLRQSLTPTTVLVREQDWDTLIQELERAGYLPEIID